MKKTPTPRAEAILTLMRKVGVRGNPKDYVVIAGDMLMDWAGDHRLFREATGAPAGVKGVALLHKRRLAPVIGSELAKRFWNPATRSRVAPKMKPQVGINAEFVRRLEAE